MSDQARQTLRAVHQPLAVYVAGLGRCERQYGVSPQGDPPGFVKGLDKHTLAIPDRPGNNRADLMENILQNPRVGMVFMIPGKTETLRISGIASIVRDPDLLASKAIRGQAPKLAIGIDVHEAFFHCSNCMIRSKLWQPQDRPSL